MSYAHLLVDRGRRDSATAIFGEFVRVTEARRVRLMAYRGLARVGGGDAFARLVAALSDDDDRIRQLAAQEIPRLPGLVLDGRRNLTLAQAVTRRRDATANILIHGFIRRGKPDALAFIRRVLAQRRNAADSGSIDRRAVALRGFGILGGAAVVPDLVRFLAAGGRDESRAVVAALIAMEGSQVDAAIARSLSAGSLRPLPKLRLIGALGQRRTAAAAASLARVAAEETVFGVRLAALRYLSGMPERVSCVAAARLLASRATRQERGLAEDLMARVLHGSKDRDARAREIESILRKAGSSNVRSLLRVLGRVGGRSALAIAVSLIDAKEAAVVAAAAETVVRLIEGRVDSTGAESGLRAVLRVTRDPELRRRAETLLARIR